MNISWWQKYGLFFIGKMENNTDSFVFIHIWVNFVCGGK